MPLSITKTASQVPSPQVLSSFLFLNDYDLSTSVPALKAARSILRGDIVFANDFNRNAAYLDILSQYGGGAIGIIHGLEISAGTGLKVSITAGGALVGAVVQFKTNQTDAVIVTASGDNFIWLKQDGTFTSVYNSTTPPAGACCYLGCAVTNVSTVTSVDGSGIVYLNSSIPYRAVGNSGVPLDAPPSNWVGLTKCNSGGSYFWNGTQYLNALTESDLTAYIQSTTLAQRTTTPLFVTPIPRLNGTCYATPYELNGSRVRFNRVVSSTFAAGEIYYHEFTLSQPKFINQLGLYIRANAGGASKKFCLGIYNANNSELPANLIRSTGVVTVASGASIGDNGIFTTVTNSTSQLQIGKYFLAFVTDTARDATNWDLDVCQNEFSSGNPITPGYARTTAAVSASIFTLNSLLCQETRAWNETTPLPATATAARASTGFAPALSLMIKFQDS